MINFSKKIVSKWLGISESQATPTPVAGQLHWTCNICGSMNRSLAISIDRESGPCSQCGSVMRFRSLMAVLTEHLYGEVRVLANLAQQPALKGLGMSDADCYATVLAEKCDYTNTYYHCDPLLDITNPAEQWLGNNDFVITSDVFEHVPPPIQHAFDNLFALLKPGGVAVFSVPYLLDAETREHYPNLYKFTITQDQQGEWELHNTTRDGQSEVFRNLIFHGGPGSTLELRLFSLVPLMQHFEKAGFVDFCIHSDPCFEHGIYWRAPWSITLSVVRPKM